MQVVSSTPLVFLVIALMMLAWRRHGVTIFLATAPFGMTAALNLPSLGGTTMVAMDVAVPALLAVLLCQRRGLATSLETVARGTPGIALMAFLAFAALATVFLPRIFAGQIEVFSIGRVANAIGIVSRPLEPGGGNLSQLVRFALGVGAFVALATYALRRPDPAQILTGMKWATALHVGLGLADLATNAANQEWLMSIFRTANYSLTLGQRMAGLNRMIGGFPEASAYGYLSVGLFGFWVSYWIQSPDHRTRSGVWLALVTFVLLRSTSSSAYVGAALFLALFVPLHTFSNPAAGISRRGLAIVSISVAFVPTLVLGLYSLYELVPAVSDFLDRALLNKLDSNSGQERMSWNIQAWSNFVDTHFLGAGLGSVRASNWLISCLATVGIPGTALYLWFLWRVFTLRSSHLPAPVAGLVTALKYGCLAFLARALVTKPSPDLSIMFFAMAGLACGLCLAYARLPRIDRAPIIPIFSSIRARQGRTVSKSQTAPSAVR